MPLPDFPAVDDQTLRAIAVRHHLEVDTISPLPQVGIFNTLFALGPDLILRIPRNDDRFVSAARNEAIAVPLARAAGVRTPALLVFDDSGELLPVPYGIYERVPGTMLAALPGDPALAAPVWRELGHDLALLHSSVRREPPASDLVVHDEKTDPRPLPEIIARAGYFSAVEAAWLTTWLDLLAPAVESGSGQVFLHNDSQSTNVIVDPATGAFAAVIDWGSCRWDDAAFDFAGIPLRAVPAMLTGYREAGGPEGDAIEARILWRHLQIGLHQLRGQPVPLYSWGERPMGILFEVFRFFLENEDPRWREWRPR